MSNKCEYSIQFIRCFPETVPILIPWWEQCVWGVWRSFLMNIKTMKTMNKCLHCAYSSHISLKRSCWGIKIIIILRGQWCSNFLCANEFFFQLSPFITIISPFARRCPMKSTEQLLQSLIKCLAQGHPDRPSPDIRSLIKHFSLSHCAMWLISLNLQHASLQTIFALLSLPHQTFKCLLKYYAFKLNHTKKLQQMFFCRGTMLCAGTSVCVVEHVSTC